MRSGTTGTPRLGRSPGCFGAGQSRLAARPLGECSKVGDIQSAQGDLAGALKTYQESQGIAERPAAADPSNAGWQRDLSVSLNKVGDIQSAQGDLAGALKTYQESQGIAERLAAADPSNAGWQRDLAVCHFKLGSVAQQQGREDLTRSHFTAMLAVFDAMDRRGLHISPSDRAGLEAIRQQVADLAPPASTRNAETGLEVSPDSTSAP